MGKKTKRGQCSRCGGTFRLKANGEPWKHRCRIAEAAVCKVQVNHREKCGPPCRELNDRAHAMHLLKLGGLSDWKCYRDTAKAGARPNYDTCRSAAARIITSDSFQKSLDWHRKKRERAYWATKARQVERLAARAEHDSLADFAHVEDGVIVVHDTAGLSRDALRAVKTLKDTKHGVEIQLRDGVPAERLLAEICGHKEPVRHVLEHQGTRPYLDELLEATKAGDQRAAEALAAVKTEGVMAAHRAWTEGRGDGEE